ncbi:NAD(P)H-binding protein [Nocardia veterana]|uniref:NAD(P)H-binding protein n=1 Tax=Nocardia veterana TaxID=132249 RepID=A0A7X6RGF4_9NOCA|nr:NAD(P)H-binding protein [Nocardia veterana]NKY85087.1 NAD(P)H-binding protein [Nocardia veterana]
MTILVTGATGNIGRLLVDQLLARGATNVRALTNNPARAALPSGVEVVEGYLRRLDTLPAAFAGVERMYLAPTPETATEVLALARQAGIRHVVDLSGEPESWWGGVTAAVEASGLAWTHLWPGDFMENVRIWARQIREIGAVHEPYPDRASAPIAMADIAAVAAVALLGTGHEGESYSLAGPEVLTRAELVRQLGVAIGREIPFVQVSRERTIEVLTPTMGDTATWYVDSVLGGMTENPQEPVHSVAELTGKPATSFAEWAATHAEKVIA